MRFKGHIDIRVTLFGPEVTLISGVHYKFVYKKKRVCGHFVHSKTNRTRAHQL